MNITRTNKALQQHWACIVNNTVEPPIRDHPKFKDLMVAYAGRWSLMRIELQGSPVRRGPNLSTFW